MVNAIFKRVSDNLPGLNLKLKQAGILDEPHVFVKKTAISAFYITTGLIIAIGSILIKLNFLKSAIIIIFPLVFIASFLYILRLPDIIIVRKEREISREIVFAGRFLMIEMKSGVPLYDAMKNVARNYESTGKYFQEIVDMVDLGTPLEDAISQQIEVTPSSNFRKVLWQILNSLKTGADISASLSSTVDQIAKEQMIDVREYGRKLNPIAMFYLIIAVIMPSIGIVMLIILGSFLSLRLSLPFLLAMTGFVGFFQFMFLTMIKSQRPPVEI
ncbi:type II secretion system F family protein [Candidatus Woesearchaeota archaeon]|nr:type II secretion system F family protein [Candidatus Woesearchaeota archaeon]